MGLHVYHTHPDKREEYRQVVQDSKYWHVRCCSFQVVSSSSCEVMTVDISS